MIIICLDIWIGFRQSQRVANIDDANHSLPLICVCIDDEINLVARDSTISFIGETGLHRKDREEERLRSCVTLV